MNKIFVWLRDAWRGYKDKDILAIVAKLQKAKSGTLLEITNAELRAYESNRIFVNTCVGLGKDGPEH
ncbi:MAG: hypothetical protein HKM94_08135 [Halobacteria archaeon]|nr:hypothetical protein [Halobacteria archaeon]